MKKGKRKLPTAVKIIFLLLFCLFAIGIAVVAGDDVGCIITELLPDTLFDISGKKRKKGNDNTDDVL